ncbi:YetF domain-containing protein [Botrimarina sp.]|uniref:DUF421 domain-containing protein n=1 Tax=Botrimarina sp. TaxID=2795802 RepID=UPI0032EEEE79
MPDFKMIFDGWEPVLRTLIVGTLAYAALVMLLRLSGKRTLSKMNAFDFVVTVAFGSVLAAVLTSSQVSLAQGVTALGLLIVLQLVNTSIAVRSDWYRSVIKAEPTLLYFRGEYLDDALRKQRVTREEVLAAMRQSGLSEPEKVDAVVMETEGSLSVLPRDAATLDSITKSGVDVRPTRRRQLGQADKAS